MFKSCSILFGQLVVASLPGLSTLLSGATGRTLVSSSSTATKGAELASRKNLPRLISLARKFLVKPNSCYSRVLVNICVLFFRFFCCCLGHTLCPDFTCHPGRFHSKLPLTAKVQLIRFYCCRQHCDTGRQT